MGHEAISLLFQTSQSFKADFVAFRIVLCSVGFLSYFWHHVAFFWLLRIKVYDTYIQRLKKKTSPKLYFF